MIERERRLALYIRWLREEHHRTQSSEDIDFYVAARVLRLLDFDPKLHMDDKLPRRKATEEW